MGSQIDDDAGQAPLGARRAVASISRATWAPFPSSLEIVVEDRAEEPIEQNVAIGRIELGGGPGPAASIARGIPGPTEFIWRVCALGR